MPANLSSSVNPTNKKEAPPYCPTCQREGHSEEKCLKKTKERVALESAMGRDAESCYKCGMIGHWYNDCPDRDTAVSHDLTGEKIRCFNCGKLGHEREHCIKKLGRKAMMSKEDRLEMQRRI